MVAISATMNPKGRTVLFRPFIIQLNNNA